MMRVAVVGAGQSGLILARGLAEAGVEVDLFTGRFPGELREDLPVPTQLTFASTLAAEAELGMAHHAEAPRFATAGVWAHTPDGTAVGFTGCLPGRGGVAVDPRLKLAQWLESLILRSQMAEREHEEGKEKPYDPFTGETLPAEDLLRVHLHVVTLDELDWYSTSGRFDLIVMAVGGGRLGALFGHEGPAGRRRALAQVLLRDLPPGASELEVHTSPAGEVLRIPTLTPFGPCDALVMIGDAGGPMDLHPPDGRPRPAEVLGGIIERLHTHIPELGARAAKAEPVEEAPLLDYTQTRPRRPVGVLPSDGLVLGLGDTVRPLCPTTGQGWAGSTRAAQIYLQRILARAREGRPFDAQWMESVCADYDRSFVQPAGAFVEMVNDFWTGQLSEIDQQRFQAAVTDRQAAEAWLATWDDPTLFAASD